MRCRRASRARRSSASMCRTRSILPAPYDIARMPSHDRSHLSDDVSEGGEVFIDAGELHAHRVDTQMSRSELPPGGHVAEPVPSGLAGAGESSLDTDLLRTPTSFGGVAPNVVDHCRGLVVRSTKRHPPISNAPDPRQDRLGHTANPYRNVSA